jgi:hypothetical protein
MLVLQNKFSLVYESFVQLFNVPTFIFVMLKSECYLKLIVFPTGPFNILSKIKSLSYDRIFVRFGSCFFLI